MDELIAKLRDCRCTDFDRDWGPCGRCDNCNRIAAADSLTTMQDREATLIRERDAAREALQAAVGVIEGERQVMIDSHKQLSGKYKGQVIDREVNKDIAILDKALGMAREALGTSGLVERS